MGLLVIAEEETEFDGDVVEHLQKKRVTLLGLTADERLCRRADDVLKGEIEQFQRVDEAGQAHEQSTHRPIEAAKEEAVRVYAVRQGLARYIGEFAGGHNTRAADTIQQMTLMARGMMGKRLLYQKLIAEA